MIDKELAQNNFTSLSSEHRELITVSEALQGLKVLENELHKSGDIDWFLTTILEKLMTLTQAEYGTILTFNNEGSVLNYYQHGIPEERIKKIGRTPEGKGLLNTIFHYEGVLNIKNLAEHPYAEGFPGSYSESTSLLSIAFRINDEMNGVIYMADKGNKKPFTQNDEIIIEMFSIEVAHMVERHGLLRELMDANKSIEKEGREQEILFEKLRNVQDQLMQSEKLASIGQLAAGVAHEINNPVGYINSNISSLENHVSNLLKIIAVYESSETFLDKETNIMNTIAAIKEKLELGYLKEDVLSLISETKEGITRVRKIVQDLSDFSHVDESEWQWIDLHKGIDSTLNIVNNEIKYKADVVKEYGDLPEIECFPSQLNQVFMNLLVNAAHAINERGIITIRSGIIRNEQVWIEITDTGCGINTEHKSRLFDPFFTTKPVGKGTGLGLSISFSIIQKHGGNIDVDSEEGKGTTFRVTLPIKHDNDISVTACHDQGF